MIEDINLLKKSVGFIDIKKHLNILLLLLRRNGYRNEEIQTNTILFLNIINQHINMYIGD